MPIWTLSSKAVAWIVLQGIVVCELALTVQQRRCLVTDDLLQTLALCGDRWLSIACRNRLAAAATKCESGVALREMQRLTQDKDVLIVDTVTVTLLPRS